MPKILIIHGPNLNFLGTREIDIYGKLTLEELNSIIKDYARKNKAKVKIFQSNCEGRIIDIMAKHIKWADFIIINPAAYTHYSYAIRDAIKSINIPVIEVHLSNIYKRENFRKISVIKDVCASRFYGEGVNSYLKAIDWCIKRCRK